MEAHWLLLKQAARYIPLQIMGPLGLLGQFLAPGNPLHAVAMEVKWLQE
jgi:hypothetical protein